MKPKSQVSEKLIQTCSSTLRTFIANTTACYVPGKMNQFCLALAHPSTCNSQLCSCTMRMENRMQCSWAPGDSKQGNLKSISIFLPPPLFFGTSQIYLVMKKEKHLTI